VDNASSHDPQGHIKLRVACEAERADETAGSIRMATAISIATGVRDDFIVKTPSPLHRNRA
jgi:hypothetical protein